MAELNTLKSLSSLVGNGGNLPLSAMAASAQAPNADDQSAQRFQGISDQFQEGGLTPLTAILKGVTGQVAASKKEKAQAQRDAKQKELNDLIAWDANNKKLSQELDQMTQSHAEMQLSGLQLAQGIDQAALGDESGVRNWMASNPQTQKMLSDRLGVPVESATFSKINGVDMLTPYGRDPQGNIVTGDAMPVDGILKAYAPAAYEARYATRQAQAVADKEAQLTDAKIAAQNAQAENYKSQAENRGNTKPLPAPAVKMQNEALESIGSLSQTNQNIDKMLSAIDDGYLHTDWLNRSASKLANASGHSTPQSRALANYDANIKKMVNDSLLLAKGVQTEGDAQRAADAIMAAPYDTAAVRERLQELKDINARSVELKKVANDQMRSNFGAEPLDYSPYEGTQASPASAQSQFREGQTATNPQTGQKITFKGGKWQ